MKLEKYSFGIGDRFGQQGKAQLEALIKAKEAGIEMVPVWNKSNREHQIIQSTPKETLLEADEAVKALQWEAPYYVDADHINLKTVDPFLDHANFFTLDVADYIGSEISEDELREFLDLASPYEGELVIPGINKPFKVTHHSLVNIARNFLGAVREATAIYNHIAKHKGAESFIAEVSMDEVEEAQTPVELFFILMMIKQYGIPAQTIAPKFTGRFNKGVDYVGDTTLFRKEFEEDLLVISFAVKTFGLPDNLKLSVHSGSDKFTIYPIMGELIQKHQKGIHVKTAGTTWLEEVIGLAMAGGEALQMAKDIYSRAYERQDELCGPYATVIDIDPASLPKPAEVELWDSETFASTLRHIPEHPNYHSGFRQLIHVGYKVAAELGEVYLAMVRKHHEVVGEQVMNNIYERHIQRLFEATTR
ncbi:MAG: tagaturonate epimerase family protein [Bacteroidales bacterium]|nr:tagaturonate epimerase family protein [Bacteroidales bacterium]